MGFASVRVSGPRNRLIYINSNYGKPAGNSSADTFPVPTGGQLFETVDGSNCIDHRKKFRVAEGETDVTVVLDPVVPPEPV